MGLILLIILIILLAGGGYGWRGGQPWGAPMGLLGLVLIIVLVFFILDHRVVFWGGGW
jgi:hypothetical protein